MKTRKEIKEQAKAVVKTEMWNILGFSLLIGIITSIVGQIPAIFGAKLTETYDAGLGIMMTKNTTLGNAWSLVESLVSIILAFSLVYYMVKKVRGEQVTVKDALLALKDKALIVVLTSIVQAVIIGLGFVCLVIPGIILACGLTMCQYLLVDSNASNPIDVIKESWNLMKGHKMDYVIFNLSFIGWVLLCVLVIPAIYAIPYMAVAEVVFYEEIKKSAK